MPTKIEPKLMRERFHYDPISGALIHKRKYGTSFKDKYFNTKCAGKIAHCRSVDLSGRTSYIVLIHNKTFQAARVIWAIVTGEDPGLSHVDHKDGNALNNKIENLRLATPSQNSANKGRQRNNTSGYAGVYKQRKSYSFGVKTSTGRRIVQGGYPTAIEAAIARDIIACVEHGEFFRPSVSTSGRPLPRHSNYRRR